MQQLVFPTEFRKDVTSVSVRVFEQEKSVRTDRVDNIQNQLRDSKPTKPALTKRAFEIEPKTFIQGSLQMFGVAEADDT